MHLVRHDIVRQLAMAIYAWLSVLLVKAIPDALDWDKYQDVPIGIVTGTNGKTTSVRLATHVLRAAGHNVGLSSTDWIAVNDNVIDRGDWSGPGGARAVLREKNVDVAILETARGGLLRRGLGVERADAALITNISEDHLGDFGSQDLNELLDIKWIVSRAVEKSGRLILNAEDPLLRAKAGGYGGEVVWFSLDPQHKKIAAHTAAGGLAFVLDGDELLMLKGDKRELICCSHEIPITMGGAARHNVANALAAAALTWSLGVSLKDIREGLKTMSRTTRGARTSMMSTAARCSSTSRTILPPCRRCSTWRAPCPRSAASCASGRPAIVLMSLIRDLAHNAWKWAPIAWWPQSFRPTHHEQEHGDVFASSGTN